MEQLLAYSETAQQVEQAELIDLPVLELVESKKRVYTYDEVFDASMEYFGGDDLAAKVFVDKYALQGNNGEYLELTPTDTHHRLAKELARAEAKYPNPMSEDEIFALLDKFESVILQGSPMSAIGNTHQLQSAGNCFVIDAPLDSYGGICKSDQELAQLMKRRSGVGLDISNIRPKGLATKNAAKTTDGIGIFMERFSNTCREVAQCIARDQLVLTNHGLKPIEIIDPNVDKVWTKIGWVKVLDKVSSGKKNIHKITTNYGLSVKTSEDHVFIISEGNGKIIEKRLKDLSVGDKIVIIPGVPTHSKYIKLINNYAKYHSSSKNIKIPETLDVDLAYLIGYSYGDGTVEKNKDGDPATLSLACSNDYINIKNKLNGIIKSLLNYDVRVYSGDGDLEKYTIHSREFLEFLKENELLKQLGHNISVPKLIMNSSSDVQLAFISGFFDADGHVKNTKTGYKFYSTSQKFIIDIQKILLSNGILAKKHVEYREQNRKDMHYLVVCGGYMQQKFIESLSCLSIKVAANKIVASRDSIMTPYNIHSLNIKYNDIKDVKTLNNFSTRKYMEIVNRFELMNELLIEDEIISIDQDDENIETYDLVLEKEHLFWCEGFYVHNSGRRGALLQSISIEHPEVETFISIKKDLKKVTGANISLRLTDEFMNAVKNDDDFTLRWPCEKPNPTITKSIKAKELWDKIIDSAWGVAEPGLFFWQNVIKNSIPDLYADEYPDFRTQSSNPCGEILMGIDSCRLTVINLTACVKNPFTKKATFDFQSFDEITQKAQRIMDDIIELEIELINRIIDKIIHDPEPEDIKATELNMWKRFLNNCKQGRRTGLGITALGDTLAMLGIRYGSKESIDMTYKIYRALAVGAHTSSCVLAKERGAFPAFDYSKEKNHEYLGNIMDDCGDEVKNMWKTTGRRNIALTTTAPVGSISVLAKTTSGIEPAYLLEYKRRKKINPSDKNARVDFTDPMGDKWQEFVVHHHGVKKWMEITGETDIEKSPYWGATSNDVDWIASVDLQAAAQKSIDHSISKTCNLPNSATKDLVSEVYMRAWESGCKGFTVYRDGCRTGVLVSNDKPETKDSDNRNKPLAQTSAPKRPDDLPCDIKKAKIQGEQWTMFVGMLNGQPYEVFGGLSKYVDIPNKHKAGTIHKNGKVDGISTYNLTIGEGDDQMTIRDIANVFDNANYGAFSRTISLSLRHGVPVQYIVEQLQKDKHSDITSFSKVMARVLKSYIQDGAKSASEKTCPSCKQENTLIYQEGCMKCNSCSFSRC